MAIQLSCTICVVAVCSRLSDCGWVVHVLNFKAVKKVEDAVGGMEVVMYC